MKTLPKQIAEHLHMLCCPGCGAKFEASEGGLRCSGCQHAFDIDDDLPLLYWPEDGVAGQEDLTRTVKAFYEETPFPDYNDFDSVATLADRARRGIFARMLDEQVPSGARIIECGCGTGQLSNFLSIANRTVFGADICVNSLRLGQGFAREQQLPHVQFLQMNLFRPVFKPESFDLVISNGVLMTTVDPFLGFQSIARLVRPGGFILIGLYHRYGRLLTDARRQIYRLTGDRFQWLDPVLRSPESSEARKRAWFKDQYKHPHEMKHTIGTTLRWLHDTGFDFVRSIPCSKPFRPFSESEKLFEAEEPGNALERAIVELGMGLRSDREGGFFTVIGQKPLDARPHEPMED